MGTLANLKPTCLDIERARGDTFAFVLFFFDKKVFEDTGVKQAVDLTGNTFELTVNTSPAPVAGVPAPTFTNVPVLFGAGTDGKIQITLSTSEADQTPSTYFHDIEAIDGGGLIRSLAKGQWVVVQDITK